MRESNMIVARSAHPGNWHLCARGRILHGFMTHSGMNPEFMP
jgi:hypothetical protein